MRERLRIALVSREYPPGPRSGGIGTYTQKTARALAGLGQEVHVFTEAASGQSETIDQGARVHYLPSVVARPDERRVVQRAWLVARALRAAGPFDVVQACEWDAEGVAYAWNHRGVMVTRLATPFYIVDGLNGPTARSRVRTAIVGRLERLQARLSDLVISPSQVLVDAVRQDWRLERERFAVVPTGIDIPKPGRSASLPAGVNDRPYVLYFGRLERRKGIKTWIDALPSILGSHPDVVALFVGQDLGDAGMPWAEYARRSLGSLATRAVFLARLPHAELFPIVARARVVVMPSRWESIANACLEAMALSRPVVATEGSGFAEIIRDGIDGILVQPDDRDALVRAVDRLLDDPSLMERIGSAAATRARDFDLHAMAGRLLELYRGLARDHVAPAVPQVT